MGVGFGCGTVARLGRPARWCGRWRCAAATEKVRRLRRERRRGERRPRVVVCMRRLHRRAGVRRPRAWLTRAQAVKASPKNIAKNAASSFFFFGVRLRGPNDALADTFYTGMTRCFYLYSVRNNNNTIIVDCVFCPAVPSADVPQLYLIYKCNISIF